MICDQQWGFYNDYEDSFDPGAIYIPKYFQKYNELKTRESNEKNLDICLYFIFAHDAALTELAKE